MEPTAYWWYFFQKEDLKGKSSFQLKGLLPAKRYMRRSPLPSSLCIQLDKFVMSELLQPSCSHEETSWRMTANKLGMIQWDRAHPRATQLCCEINQPRKHPPPNFLSHEITKISTVAAILGGILALAAEPKYVNPKLSSCINAWFRGVQIASRDFQEIMGQLRSQTKVLPRDVKDNIQNVDLGVRGTQNPDPLVNTLNRRLLVTLTWVSLSFERDLQKQSELSSSWGWLRLPKMKQHSA